MSSLDQKKKTRRSPAELKADNLANFERAKKQPDNWVMHLPVIRYGGTTRLQLQALGLETMSRDGVTYVKYSSGQLPIDCTPFVPQPEVHPKPEVHPLSAGEIITRFIEDARTIAEMGITPSSLVAGIGVNK